MGWERKRGGVTEKEIVERKAGKTKRGQTGEEEEKD